MRIAITGQDFTRVTGHLRHARRFIIFEVRGNGPIRVVELLDPESHLSIHGLDRKAAHPWIKLTS